MRSTEPSWAGVFAIAFCAVLAIGWSFSTGYTFVDLLVHGETIDAVSLRTREGSRRGHWTTTFRVRDGECEVGAVHVEPGETAQLIVDRDDPSRCVADSFFPTLWWPISCGALGAVCVAVAISQVRQLLRR